MEKEEERGGDERGREVETVGTTGSQRASRSGLLSRGMGLMSPPIRADSDASHAPRSPEESSESDEEIKWKRRVQRDSFQTDNGNKNINGKGGRTETKVQLAGYLTQS